MSRSGYRKKQDLFGALPQGADEHRLLAELHTDVAIYYTFKIARYGATPQGVDWSCAESQDRRFRHLLLLCDFSAPRSLNDVGCGYGAMLSYLDRFHGAASVDYLGTDLSESMVRRAEALWQDRPKVQFQMSRTIARVADYSIASGIFNVKLRQPVDAWEFYIAQTLKEMKTHSRLGFAVNFVTAAAEAELGPTELYCAPTDRWIGYCAHELDSKVDLIKDDDLGEFTLLVRNS